MIRNFRHKGLERFFSHSETRGINAKQSARIARMLDRLESASKPEDMNLPGYGFHGLSGYTPKRYDLKVSGNWRITFAFDGEDALDVNLEDYH
ncbi:MAG: type II toxin-antitoxin system RelE/ParE family toxin [Pseudomonadota bacterium]|nr:type II toxin-antitoxin system RelE/ParE family toxin [Pseudomonadota bacterium]MDP1904100.1 type II toxin-antitoxin system RelE/ParE family toxin [Pseudomonadota bacterium]MDP2354215.1 type II toxin-antitoxin system RelE/ParE family toxin [Pseudomonadota bacterium]